MVHAYHKLHNIKTNALYSVNSHEHFYQSLEKVLAIFYTNIILKIEDLLYWKVLFWEDFIELALDE